MLGALGGSSLLAAQANGTSAEPGESGTRFAVISDTHLGRNDSRTPEKQWREAVEEMSDLSLEFALHLGDVVDRGREEQYAVYRKIRESLNIPVHEIPGNHDPAALFQEHIRKEIDTSAVYGDVRFVLFNNSRSDSHDGFIADAQLDWMERECASAAAQAQRIVICAHVPIHSNRPPDRAWYVKPANGQKRFYEILTRHKPRVVAALHGHFHNGIRGWSDHAPVHEVLLPSLTYNLNRGLTEKGAPGYNLNEFRPGYVIATLGRSFLTLAYKPLGAEISVEKRLKLGGG